jgi:hypothetical protein
MKQPQKPLKLRKETVRALTHPENNCVIGGAPDSFAGSCVEGCDTVNTCQHSVCFGTCIAE